MISIIIPTLNEEKYLPRLLNCIKAQAYKDYEIIIADNNSKDATLKIAKKYKCKVTGGGHPGIGRNKGAKIAKGGILLFLDADVAFGRDFIKNALSRFESQKLDVAGCYLYPSISSISYSLFFGIFNVWASITQFFYPNAYGGAIFCKNGLHKKISGFDESILLSEDMDYVKRAGKLGKFRLIKGSKIYFSVRRFEEEGKFRLASKLFLSSIYRIFVGEIRTDVFKYRMDSNEHKGKII